MIAYYEVQSAQPPGALLVDLARALKVSTDELLGVKPVRETLSPKTARLLKRLRRIEELPPADQRAVLKEHTIHGKDGKISAKNSYGSDPCPPKDGR